MDEGVLIATVYLGLFATSIFYNRLVAWMEREGLLNGYMAILVVGGVLYTLFGMAFIVEAETIVLLAGAFIAALIPMVWGDVSRYLDARIDWREFWGRAFRKNKDGED